MNLLIKVEFDHELTPQAQREVRRLVLDLKEELESLGGTVLKAELVGVLGASEEPK